MHSQVATDLHLEQQAPDPRVGMESSVPATAPSQPPNPGTDSSQPGDMDAVALGARGLVALDELEGNGLLFGIANSEGYGWVRSNAFSNSNGALSVLQPYIGFAHGGRLTKAVFQYVPTINVYDGQRFDGSWFHQGTVDGIHRFDERWSMKFSGMALHGPESVRQIATLALGEGNGAINGLAYALPSKSLTLAQGSAGLAWSRTPRQELTFTAADSYALVSRGGGADTGTLRAQIATDLGRDSQWSSYVQIQTYSDQLGQVLYGFGAGYKTTYRQNTTLRLEGGPEFSSGGRGGRISAAFSGALEEHVLQYTTLYLRAERDLSVPYLSQSRWADDFSVGLRQVTSRNTFVKADTAYVQSVSISSGQQRLHGFLSGVDFHWRLTDTLSVITAYRYFNRENPVPSTPDRHTWALCTLVWQPASHAIKR